MRTFIRRYDYLIQWLAGLGIPVALVLSSWLITTSIERTKVDSEYVRIALSILTAEQNPDTKTKGNDDATSQSKYQLALRKWAIRLLNKKSPESFTDEEQEALLEGHLSSVDISGFALQLIGLDNPISSKSVTKQNENITGKPK